MKIKPKTENKNKSHYADIVYIYTVAAQAIDGNVSTDEALRLICSRLRENVA